MSKFKPAKNEKLVISIRIDQEKLSIIDDIAKKTDISRNEVINQCLEYAIENSEFKTGRELWNSNKLFF